MYKVWVDGVSSEFQIQGTSDVQFELPCSGRPTAIPSEKESAIEGAIRILAKRNTLLSNNGAISLDEQYIEMISDEERDNIFFKNGKP